MSYTYQAMNTKDTQLRSQRLHSPFRAFSILLVIGLLLFNGCKGPEEDIVLRQIRNVNVDASADPMLKANAIFYNPNKLRGKLKKIDIEIFVNGKKAGSVNQHLKTVIPSRGEFTVPIEVKLSLKEQGFLDTVLGLIGGRKFEVRYSGSLKLNYRGFPVHVPVDYKDEVRIRL